MTIDKLNQFGFGPCDGDPTFVFAIIILINVHR